MARRRWLLWIAAVVVVGGCGPSGGGLPGTGPGGEDLDRLPPQARGALARGAQAREPLARYDQAVGDAGGSQGFVPVGDLTGQLGDWEPANGDNNKAALLSGRVRAATALPAAPQPTGK